MGVKRAVQVALKAAETEAGPVYMLGDIVHNEHVIRELNEAGLHVVDSVDQIASGTLLIRAHGAIPSVYETAQRKGLKIIDATCPLVLEIHKIVRQLQDEGYTIVIIGDHDHEEVIGIAGQVTAARVLAAPEEALTYESNGQRLGVVVQSTQNIENVQKIMAILAGKCRELRFFNTICYTTTNHQRDIRTLPKENDVMVIIGSRTSANTCRLTEIATALNPRTYQVESAEDLRAEWFAGADSVGVSAGASTPEVIMQQVITRLEQLTGCQ